MSFPYTVEQIEAAYAKTGLVPVCRTWATKIEVAGQGVKDCGCGLVALHIASVDLDKATRLSLDLSMNSFDVQKTLGLTYEQRTAFTTGFDGRPFVVWSDDKQTEAYRAGREARDRIRPVDPFESS